MQPGQVLANMDAAVLEAQLREAEADKLRAETDRNVAAAVVGQHESEYDLALKTLNRTRRLFQQKALEQSQLDKDSGTEQTAAAMFGQRPDSFCSCRPSRKRRSRPFSAQRSQRPCPRPNPQE